MLETVASADGKKQSEGWDAVPLLLGVGIRQKTVHSSLLSLLSRISNTSTHRPRRAWETASLLGLAHEKMINWSGMGGCFSSCHSHKFLHGDSICKIRSGSLKGCHFYSIKTGSVKVLLVLAASCEPQDSFSPHRGCKPGLGEEVMSAPP